MERIFCALATRGGKKRVHTSEPETLPRRVNTKRVVEPVEIYQVVLELGKEDEREEERGVQENGKKKDILERQEPRKGPRFELHDLKVSLGRMNELNEWKEIPWCLVKPVTRGFETRARERDSFFLIVWVTLYL